jgi:hypothetical protein
MSDLNVWNAQRETKANTVDALKDITLPTNKAGQYQHDGAVKFCNQLQQIAKEMANPEDTPHGMSKLFKEAPNALNSIKSRISTNGEISSNKRKTKLTPKPNPVPSAKSTNPASPPAARPKKKLIASIHTIRL